MAGRVEQAIKDWTIRRKILTGFSSVLVLAAGLGWVALRSLDRMNVAAGRIAQGELTTAVADQIFRDSRTAILALLLLTVAVRIGCAQCLTSSPIRSPPWGRWPSRCRRAISPPTSGASRGMRSAGWSTRCGRW
jgi:hypothetical protein